MSIPVKKWREMMLEAHLKLMQEIENRLKNNNLEPNDYTLYVKLLSDKIELQRLLNTP